MFLPLIVRLESLLASATAPSSFARTPSRLTSPPGGIVSEIPAAFSWSNTLSGITRRGRPARAGSSS
jgi:hypothetical protein